MAEQKKTGPHSCVQAAFLQSNIGEIQGRLWEGGSWGLTMRTCSDEDEMIGISRHQGNKKAVWEKAEKYETTSFQEELDADVDGDELSVN